MRACTHFAGLLIHKLLQRVQVPVALVALEVVGLLVEELERGVSSHIVVRAESSFHRAVHLQGWADCW